MSPKRDLVHWDCPVCGQDNEDIPNQTTHCSACGQVVMVGDDDNVVEDLGYFIPTDYKTIERKNNVPS